MVMSSSSSEVLQRVRECLFFAGCEKLVAGSEDGKVVVWEWEASELAVQELDGHGDRVSHSAADSSGARITSCSDNGTLRICDLSTGTQTWKLSMGKAVSSIAVCAENQVLAIVSIDWTRRVLDCAAKNLLFESAEVRVYCVSFSLHGLCLAAGSVNRTVKHFSVEHSNPGKSWPLSRRAQIWDY